MFMVRAYSGHMRLSPALLMLVAPLLAPASLWAADKPAKGRDERSYVYFRPAPVATSSALVARQALSDSPELLSLGSRITEAPASSLTLSPNGKGNDATRGVSLQLRSRVQAGAAQSGATLQPSAVDVNVALGYQGFALDAGLNRTTEANRVLSRGVNLGLSYKASDWWTRLSVSEMELLPDPLTNFGLLQPSRSLAFELGSSLQLSSRWAITGGLRYALADPNATAPKVGGKKPETKAVFVGTAFNF
jgi:hypothetical protein